MNVFHNCKRYFHNIKGRSLMEGLRICRGVPRIRTSCARVLWYGKYNYHGVCIYIYIYIYMHAPVVYMM